MVLDIQNTEVESDSSKTSEDQKAITFDKMSDQFTANLLNEFKSRKETDVGLAKKKEIAKLVDQRVKDFDPEARAVPFGSYTTRFSLQGGDLDVVILTPKAKDTDHDKKIEFLNKLKDFWLKQETSGKYAEAWINSKTEMVKAKNVPKMRLVTKDGFKIDVSVFGDAIGHSGIRNTHLLMCYSAIDECVAQLIILIKSWAKHHQIVDAVRQRLNSTSLALMAIFFLQNKGLLPVLQASDPSAFDPSRSVITGSGSYDLSRQDPILMRHKTTPKAFNGKLGDARLGDLLVEFFRFYAHFKFADDVISVRTGSALTKAKCLAATGDAQNDWDAKEFYIEDPFNRRNVARCTGDAAEGTRIKTLLKTTASNLDKDKSVKSIFF